MPTNPFGRMGSTGGEREIASQTRAVKAYDQARKKLISTMANEERAAAGVAAAHSAAMQQRARDHSAYERELKNTSTLLSAQGDALKNLDTVRARYHNEEMKRSSSLLQKYEGIKIALREVQQDSVDTSTVLGSLFQPFTAGIDNLRKFGELPKVGRAIRDVNVDFSDLSSTVDRAGGALGDMGSAMSDVFPTIWRYRQAMDDLNVGVAELKLRYADATDGTQKLAEQFVTLSRMDLIKAGAVDTVIEVTDAIKNLEAQGVNAEEALSTLVERSLTSGRSFAETAEDLREVSATADILTDRINNSESAIKGFAFTTRDDLVRAIADATRNLDSQVVSVDNVAAAYAYAQEQAAKYGVSVKGSQKIAQAFTNAHFQERQDVVGFLAGQRMQRQFTKALRDAEELMSAELGEEIAYKSATKDQQKALRESAYLSAFGIEATDENALIMEQGVDTLGEGLGARDFRNLFAGTTAAIKADLDAKMTDLNLQGLGGDLSVLTSLLEGIDGLSGLSTSEKRVYADMLVEGRSGEVAEAIHKLQEEAQERAADAENLQSSALTAVLSFKDPIQQLFNIKDYIKAIALNVSNIVKMIGDFTGLDLDTMLPDLTRSVASNEIPQEVLASMRQSSDVERQEMMKGVIEAQRVLRESTSEEERTNAQKQLDNANKELKRVEESRLDLERQQFLREEILGRDRHTQRALPEDVLPATGESSFIEEAWEDLSNYVGSFFSSNDSERGREAGVAAASTTVSQQTSQRTPQRPSAPGEVEGVGEGHVSVNTSGETVATVQIKFKNMGEAIAYHNSDTARLLNQHGLA